MEERKYVNEDELPCAGQTRQTVYAWAQQLKISDRVALRESSSHIYIEYRLGEVQALTDEGRRVLFTDSGTFWRTEDSAGDNCFYPKGQLRMVEPTASVVRAAKAHIRFVPG